MGIFKCIVNPHTFPSKLQVASDGKAPNQEAKFEGAESKKLKKAELVQPP